MAVANQQVEEEIDELRATVKSYTPGDAVMSAANVEFPEKLFIGFFGRTGCGKTSLINSMKYAVDGKLRRSKWLQTGTQEKAGGHTTLRKQAGLTNNVFVIDNRGMDKPHLQEVIDELGAQLDGKRGYTHEVEWDGEKSPGQDVEALGDKLATAVFVFSASHAIGMNVTGLEEVVKLLHNKQGRYPVAVITHVDAVELNDVDRLKVALRMCGISDIFEVANVTNEKEKLEKEYQLKLLNLLDRCMTDGDETIIYHHFQRVETGRIQEKKMRDEAERAEQERRAQEADALRQKQEHAEREAEIDRRVERKRRELEQEKDQEIREIIAKNNASDSSCTLI